ncbi:MAG: hypothetical protein WCE54_02425 [Ignavibacteriaceae bacterium]
MLSNKSAYLILAIVITLVIVSCGEKKQPVKNIEPSKDFNNQAAVTDEAEKILGPEVKFAYKGNFDKDSVIEIAAGTEIENKKEWGIQFYLLKFEQNKLEKTFQTNLLKGSFKESLTKKIEFPAFDYELMYYNSQDYFLGSGGGEIFSYIIDFKNQKTFYAHLFLEKEKISLFLSDNIDNPDIKNFFIANFKRDYPNLQIVSKDVNIDI